MTVFEFAIAVVAIVFGTKLIRDIILRRHHREADEQSEIERADLESKINQLEERVRTLERITTDPSSNLAREIDGLQ